MKKRKIEIIRKIEPKKIPIKRISRLLVIFILILGIVLFFRNSRYFKLEDIEIVDASNAIELSAAELLKIYKGRNIFDVDINSLSSQIKEDFPVIETAVVKRTLPNKIEIDIVPRLAVAKVKTFPIDRTGMILSPGVKSGKLPTITGLSMWLRPRVGGRFKGDRLEKAILLIDALKESSVLSEHGVKTIDVANQKNLSFYLENDIEVKIGGEDFPERLAILKTTLKSPGLDKENIKYIDLQFKDVVIGTK